MALKNGSDESDGSASDGVAPRRLRLRDLYEAARLGVQADPDRAVADYEQSLQELIAARRVREG